MASINGADTAWLLVSTALVLIMTPALGFFYGGMVRAKNALNTLMMSFAALGFVGLAWAFFGYSLAFGHASPWLGGTEFMLLRGVGLGPQGTIPHVLFFAYQGTFAIITAALISGAIVERMRFGPYVAFISIWSLLVYAPVAHWVWGGGFLGKLGALDFAGGTVVHVNAAAAAFVCAVVVGSRKDYARRAILPQNVPLTLLGAGLLWLGWFGFNAGSALGANATAALAFVNTMLAPMATLVVWTVLDLWRNGKVTAIGAATAIVVGLVAVTPAAGFVSPLAAVTIGGLAAAPSYFALLYRARTRLDDSLDVVAAHGVGGVVGALLTGVFAQKSWNGTVDGVVGGHWRQLGVQAIALAVTIVYSAVATFLIVKAIDFIGKLRADSRDEGLGLDFTQHGEEAYSRGEGAILIVDRSPATGILAEGSVDLILEHGVESMKLVVAVIRPEKLHDVLEALFRADVKGFTISRVQGHGGELERVETYRGTTVKMELSDKVRLDIGVSDHFVDVTIDALVEGARTGDVGDGKIFVLPVERVVRIRTGEKDQAAVTPVGVPTG